VSHRCALVLAILIYVTLDLSLPTMPGAFEFDSADSVECTQGRARANVETAVLHVSRPDIDLRLPAPLSLNDRPTSAVAHARARRPEAPRRSPSPPDPASPSEDPH
jgi:hypothetical protein